MTVELGNINKGIPMGSYAPGEGGGGGAAKVTGVDPIAVTNGSVAIKIDEQTLQVNEQGELSANLDEIGSELNDLSGRVTAAEADILAKENKITTTGALSLQEKIQTNAVGFTVTSESAMTNDHYQRVPFPESSSSRLAIQDTSFTYPYKSYLAIPYSLGQVIRVPRAYGQLFFGSFDDNGDFIVSVGFNTFYYNTNGFALYGGPIYRAETGSSEYPPVMPRLNPTQMGYDGNYTYHSRPREAADSGDLYSLSNYLPENDFSCAFYQISPDTTGAIMIQAFWSITTGRCSTAVYRDTETSYQYAGHLDAMRNNIQYALWLPDETGTSYNPSKFGLYDWNVSRIPWSDKLGWEAFFKGRGANLYSLTGQSSKNYLELNLGDGLSVVDGKLTASSATPTNMMTTDTDQDITGTKTFGNGKLILEGWINSPQGNAVLSGGVDGLNEAYLGDRNGSTAIQGDITLWPTQQVKYKNTGDTFIHTGNMGEYVDGTTITYSGNKLSAVNSGSTTPANMVTTDTDQDITGTKTFKGPIKVTHSGYTRTLADVNTNGGVPYLYLGEPTSRMYLQASKPINRMNSGGVEYPIIDTENISSYIDGSTITWDVSTSKLTAVGGGSTSVEKYGLEGDYCSKYGIVDCPNGILAEGTGQVTLKAGVVMQMTETDGLTTNASDMPHDITSTVDFDLFYTSGALLEATQVVFSKQEPEDGATGVLAWYNGTQWQFKSNDAGNVWKSAPAVRLAHIHITDGNITRIDYIGNRHLNKVIPVTTDTTQTISGAKTFSGKVTINTKTYMKDDLRVTGVQLTKATTDNAIYDANNLVLTRWNPLTKTLTIGEKASSTIIGGGNPVTNKVGNAFLTSGDKETIMGYMMPDYSTRTEVPWNTDNTAPTDGYVEVFGEGDGATSAFVLEYTIDGVRTNIAACYATSAHTNFRLPVICPKGMVYRASKGANGHELHFISMKGAI